jgi:hypothetical protein
MAGTKYEAIDEDLDRNQTDLVDTLITPHVRIPEKLGAGCRIVSRYSSYQQETQPTQAKGNIVWNKGFSFQSDGPTFLDPVPDPGKGGGYR